MITEIFKADKDGVYKLTICSDIIFVNGIKKDLPLTLKKGDTVSVDIKPSENESETLSLQWTEE